MAPFVFLFAGVMLGFATRWQSVPFMRPLDTAQSMFSDYGAGAVTAFTPLGEDAAAAWGGFLALIAVPFLIAMYVEAGTRGARIRTSGGLVLFTMAAVGLVTHGSDAFALVVWLFITGAALILPGVIAEPFTLISGAGFATVWVSGLFFEQKWVGPVAEMFAEILGQPYGLLVVVGVGVSVLPFIGLGHVIWRYYRSGGHAAGRA